MTDFLLLYEGGDKNWMTSATPEEIEGVMQQWGAWFQQLEASGHLRNPGAALARGGAIVCTNGKGIQTDLALPEVKELIGGFSVIAAASVEEASEIAKGSPFLKNNPEGTVLVRPVAQM
jgi:hypothetical protein